jgi:hypothetical protein
MGRLGSCRTVDAFIDMVEEVVFISPCEAEFMSLNLLMLYFEKEASFQTALQSIEKDHPEVMDSKHFDAILKIVSMLSNRNYAQYLRSMAESKDLLLGHVMGLPEFINTIRIKYFCILKNLSFNQGRGEGSMDNEGGEEAPLSEYQKRLHIDTLEEMKYFLTFMYGKKNKGVELFSVERNVINLGHYQADVSELLSKISKIKLNKPIQSLKACLAAISPLNKRECSVKGPKKENSQIIKTVHQNIFSVIKRAVGDYKAIEEEPLSEEIPSEEELVKVAPTRQVLEPSKADSSLIKKKIEIDNIDQLIDKAGRKKKGAEKALLLLKKKVRTVRREVYRLWSMYSIAKSAQQLEKLKEYLDAKNEQTRFECFDQWRLQVYRRQALLEEIMEIPDFEGGMDDVVCEEYKNLTYLPHYNYYQSFIMYLFRHLLRKWFEVLAPQTILAQNLGTVQEFRLSWLFVIDRSSPDCRYLAPFLGLFLISPEESLTAIIEGTTIETEYFVENWIDRAGIVHPGRLSLAVTLQCRTAAEVSKADVLENDFIVAFGPHSVAPCLEKWCQEARQAAENKYESANDAHFASFGDLLREAGKDVIRIVPDIENCSLLLASEAMTLKDVTWRFFNFQVNHATLQAFLSVCLKRVSEMIDWVDETFFSGQFLNLKILEKTKTFGIETLLRSFHNSLLEVDSQRAMILTDDGLFMDLESQRYMRKLVIKDIEGFFYLRNLVAAVIKEIMLEAQVFPRENPGSVRLLQGLHAAILSEEINNDVYLNSSRNMIFYNYLANIMAECSPRWRALFEIDINKVIWTQIITLVAFNPIDNFSGDWLMFFIHLLECIAECLKLSAAKSNVRLVADFELRMLLDINFEDLYATAKKDHQKFLMRQYWTSERHQEFTSEIVRHSEDNLLQQSALLHDQLTPQTHTPSVSDLGEEPTHLGKRQDHIEFCYSTLNSQFFTRLLKL